MTVAVPSRTEFLGSGLPMGASPETRTIRAIEKYKVSKHYYEPVSRQKGLSLRFYNISTKWKEETRFTSSTTQICMHPLYQRIIGMGPVAVPFILKELEQEPSHWFWALKAITGQDPVPPEHIGNVEQMAKDWLEWAEEEGYEW